MVPRVVTIVLCATVAVAGCATKKFVHEQVTATEMKLTQQVTATEVSLAEHTGENRQAIETSNQRLQGLDTRVTGLEGLDGRVTEVDAAATEARARADQAAAASQDVEARLAQRLAGRNRYRVVDTKSIYFESGRIDIRQEDVPTLDEVAKALATDPNAVLELQGFADSQGSDRYNRELARERVDVVMRYLTQRHNIELRQLYGLGMGKMTLAAGEKATPEAMAEARRVDLRVLAPWSSWEERTEAPSALPEQAQREESPAPQRLPAFLRTLEPRELGGE